jgi:hypothetical protein
VSASEIGPETTLRRADRAVHGELPEETVLLDLEDKVAVRLNQTGAWLWERLEQPRTVSELADGLAAEFGIERDRALDDVGAWAADLRGRSLLETA